jgi:uncharacterized lipoprotein YmbA
VRTPTPQRTALATLALLVGSCASAPEHLYTLDTTAGQPADARSDLPIVLVGPVSVPEMVDRPQLVVREGKYGVVVNEQERWATPLKDSLPRVVTMQLGERCTSAKFRLLSSAATEEPHARLAIEFTSIEINRATGVSVVASWAYRDGSKRAIEGVGEGHADIDSTNYSSYVDGMHRSLGAWANSVATQLPQCQ